MHIEYIYDILKNIYIIYTYIEEIKKKKIKRRDRTLMDFLIGAHAVLGILADPVAKSEFQFSIIEF